MKKHVVGIIITVGIFVVMYALKKGTSPYSVIVDAASSALQMTRRGLRNNNPGNIRISSNAWLGKVSPNTDGAFEQFDTPEHGIRALGKILENYGAKYGLYTIAEIIPRWAPSTENDTSAYIASVEKDSGIGRNVKLNLAIDKNAKIALVAAIIKHENGIQPYTEATLQKGLA